MPYIVSEIVKFVIPFSYACRYTKHMPLTVFRGFFVGSRGGWGCRYIKKHWDPKFKRLRAEKYIKVDLPDYDKLRKDEALVSPEEIRTAMKKRGLPTIRDWTEHEIHMACTAAIFEPYIVPEGEGKVSILNKVAPKKLVSDVQHARKERSARNTIKEYLKDRFRVEQFPVKAQEIYVEAHKALQERDEDRLHELVTEKAFPEMWNELRLRTLKWKWIRSLEAPRIMQMRTLKDDQISKDNVYAQITVRFFSEQILAIFDQFGRLMYGDPHVARDVLEYVVFENHLSNMYGAWRVHGKVQSESMLRTKPAVYKTYRSPPPPEASEVSSEPDETADKKPLVPEPESSAHRRDVVNATVS